MCFADEPSSRLTSVQTSEVNMQAAVSAASDSNAGPNSNHQTTSEAKTEHPENGIHHQSVSNGATANGNSKAASEDVFSE